MTYEVAVYESGELEPTATVAVEANSPAEANVKAVALVQQTAGPGNYSAKGVDSEDLAVVA